MVMSPFIKDANKGFNSCIAAALRARRAQVQMTYAQVAEKSEIPEVSIIRIFTEKRAVNFAQASSIAEAMGTTVQEVVEDAERESFRRHGNPYGFDRPDTVLSVVEDSLPDESKLAAHTDDLDSEDEQ